MADPEFLVDILGITTEDIVERFEDLIKDHEEELKELYDVPLVEYNETEETWETHVEEFD